MANGFTPTDKSIHSQSILHPLPRHGPFLRVSSILIRQCHPVQGQTLPPTSSLPFLPLTGETQNLGRSDQRHHQSGQRCVEPVAHRRSGGCQQPHSASRLAPPSFNFATRGPCKRPAIEAVTSCIIPSFECSRKYIVNDEA